MDEKESLAMRLRGLMDDLSDNPDDMITELWLHEPETYERIFQERAEWVMILETAFSVLIGNIIILISRNYSPHNTKSNKKTLTGFWVIKITLA